MDTATKPRSDAWDATLDEGQRWAVYERFRRAPWYQVAKWAAEEYGVAEPSRTAIYRWADRMRASESAHRLEQAILARTEAGELAKAAKQDDAALIDAYKTLAADLAMTHGDAAGAMKFTKMALAIAESRVRGRELEIKARAQGTKEKALDLMREKFEAAERRLNQIENTVADAKLTDAERTARLKEIFGLR
jgi:hypothetical protein